ncbi:MAG: hypothetical protein PHX79_03185 [Sphaerochaetaceae bacterium]|nr:hypothetical protein [Sphaerochaetaceae bacterium]
MNVRVSEVGAENLSRVNKILAGIPGGIWKASYAALKRAGDTAKTRAGRFAAEEYTINKGDFMKNVHQKSHIKSEAGGVVSMNISYAGNVLPLLTFNTKYSRNGLLQTKVKRSGTEAILEHAFAARVFGPIGVFERVGDKRFPVEQKYGPSTAHMMQSEKVTEKMDETVRDTFENRLEHEITRVLNGWGGRS